MDKIENIDLNKELALVEEDILQEQRKKVRAAISGIVKDLKKWKEEKNKLKSELNKTEQKIENAENKYKKIQGGDWSILNDNLTKNQPSVEKSDNKTDNIQISNKGRNI